MSDELRKRLERLRKHLLEAFGSRPGGGLVCVVVEGGLLPWPIFASDDTGHEWLRDMEGGEEIEAFAQRCALAAIEHGARRLTVGGLPSTEMQREAMNVAHAAWMADGYDPVPPDGTAPMTGPTIKAKPKRSTEEKRKRAERERAERAEDRHLSPTHRFVDIGEAIDAQPYKARSVANVEERMAAAFAKIGRTYVPRKLMDAAS